METNNTIGESIDVASGSLVVLSSESGGPVGAPVPIATERVLVGRGGHCQIVLDDARVSTSHCAFVAAERGVLLVDLDSKNGTHVNRVRLEKGSAVYLPGDARIRCGQTWLEFRPTGREPVLLSSAKAFGPLIGRSVTMRRLYAKLASIASHELSVLVTGETGSGKELVVQAIHEASARRGGPFVTIDCTTIPMALAESLLFGHERGAFTGAVGRSVSPFVSAQGGTVFLDELGELPLEVQPKLLRALETHVIQSVGSVRSQEIDVRIIAATRHNLHVEMNAKRFRDDLYYRLAQVAIDVPPLREHREDIPDLVAHFLGQLGDPDAVGRIDERSQHLLAAYDWPGNVRQLRNMVLAVHAQSGGGPLDFGDLVRGRVGEGNPATRLSGGSSFQELRREVLDVLERDYFTKLRAETRGNLSEMARRAGLSRPTVRDYLRRLGLQADE